MPTDNIKEKEIKNDLNMELELDGIEVEVRFRNVTRQQALNIFEEYTSEEVKSFTWE